MKHTITYTDDGVLHLIESNEPTTVCGIDYKDLIDESVFYDKETFREAVAEYLPEELCPKCFPSKAAFETKAELVSEEEVKDFVKSVTGRRI